MPIDSGVSTRERKALRIRSSIGPWGLHPIADSRGRRALGAANDLDAGEQSRCIRAEPSARALSAWRRVGTQCFVGFPPLDVDGVSSSASFTPSKKSRL